MDVFDLASYADLMSGKRSLPVLDNPFSQRVNAIIGKVREARRGPYYPHLYIVKEDGDASLRQWALSCLIEDRLETTQSYGQFLGMLKDKVSSLYYSLSFEISRKLTIERTFSSFPRRSTTKLSNNLSTRSTCFPFPFIAVVLSFFPSLSRNYTLFLLSDPRFLQLLLVFSSHS